MFVIINLVKDITLFRVEDFQNIIFRLCSPSKLSLEEDAALPKTISQA
ncbi:MAG: hypothetical protein AAFX46_10045 [Cyanobacteria bacterium J06636_27]